MATWLVVPEEGKRTAQTIPDSSINILNWKNDSLLVSYYYLVETNGLIAPYLANKEVISDTTYIVLGEHNRKKWKNPHRYLWYTFTNDSSILSKAYDSIANRGKYITYVSNDISGKEDFPELLINKDQEENVSLIFPAHNAIILRKRDRDRPSLYLINYNQNSNDSANIYFVDIYPDKKIPN